MASSSGTSSSTCSSMEEGELAVLIEQQRKRKRMLSNRESARRSRMRKQKHLDDLMAMVEQLRKENQQIAANLGATVQHYAAVEAENSVLRAQAAELAHRLHSLDEILAFSNPCDGVVEDSYAGAGAGGGYFCADPIEIGGGGGGGGGGGFFNPLQMAFYMSQPLMASADVFGNY